MQQAPTGSAESLRGLNEGGIDAAHGIGDDQHLLKKCADENDGDLRGVVDAQHRHAERAKGRGGQVAEELDEGFLKAGKEAVGTAEDAERHAKEGGEKERPGDGANAVAEALVEPGFVGQTRWGSEGGVERRGHRVRRRQVRGIDAVADGRSGTLREHVAVLTSEIGAGDVDARGEIFHVARRGDPHQRMPDKRHVADRAPESQRQDEGKQGEQGAPPRRGLLLQAQPITAYRWLPGDH